MTEAQLASRAKQTVKLQAQMREKGFGCHCGCGCDYVLGTENARALGTCFSCRKGVHFGSTARPVLEAEA